MLSVFVEAISVAAGDAVHKDIKPPLQRPGRRHPADGLCGERDSHLRLRRFREPAGDDNHLNPFRYCGEYWDYETKRYYFRARYYSPATGRFTQRDKFLGFYADPLSLNRYTYAHNNPVKYRDPTGYWEQGDVEYDQKTQEKIAQATSDYYIAASKTPPDRAGMATASATASAARDTGTTSASNVTATGRAYSYEIKNNGSFTADSWTRTVATNALIAAQQLDNTYNTGIPTSTSTGTATYSSKFLKAGEGPNNNEHLALSTYHYIASKGNDPLLSIYPTSSSRGYNAARNSLNRWYVETSEITFEQKQTGQIVNNSDDAIKVYITGNEVTINANVLFQGDNMATHSSTGGYLGILAAEGIKEHWSGEFLMGGQWVKFNTEFACDTNSGRNIIDINIYDESGTAGARNAQNPWTKGGDKSINLYSIKPKSEGVGPHSESRFKNISAHEFGHSLGVWDYYETKEFNEVPYYIAAKNDIMRTTLNGSVNIATLDVMLSAMRSNTAQELRERK